MSDTVKTNEIVNELISSADPEQIKELYKQWSNSYDDDLATYGYVAPKKAINIFTQCTTDRQAKILDAGCGTGLVGSLLAADGYGRVDGCDFSSDMIAKAAELGCYESLSKIDLSTTVPLDTNSYDGIISVGVFNKLIKDSFVAEMLRILKPGGFLTISCREQYLGIVLDNIRDQYQGQAIRSSSIEVDDYMTGQNAIAYYVTIEKRPTA